MKCSGVELGDAQMLHVHGTTFLAARQVRSCGRFSARGQLASQQILQELYALSAVHRRNSGAAVANGRVQLLAAG
jgi:hypothetical protein